MTRTYIPRRRTHQTDTSSRPTARRVRRLAIAPALLALAALLQAGPAHAASPPDAGAAPATTALHSLGFVPDPHAPSTAQVRTPALASLPASVDLSQYDPPVGNQGTVGACSAWSTGYYLRGWYAKRDGYYPGGGSGNTGSFEPMFTYAQLVNGQNIGSTFSQNLNIQQVAGIDTRADYPQGDYDYTDQPTAAESANAAFFKIASYNAVSNGGGTSLQTWIENSFASGNPVAIGIPVYPEFDNVGPGTSYVVYPPKPGETSRGGHAVFAYKYDATGLWIKNSWGAGWGTSGDGDPNKGSAELSWSFVNGYATDAANMVPLAPFTQVPGILSSISVGYSTDFSNSPTAVWGLNSAHQIYQYNPNSGVFTSIPGQLSSISVGSDGTVWGLNSAGQIYRYNPSTGGFTSIPGILSSISVGNAFAVWGLNSAGQIYAYSSSTGGFTSIPGKLASLSVGSDGTVWGLNASGQIYQLNPSTGGFTQVPGILAHIAVAAEGSATGEVWGLNAAGAIYRFSPNSGGFTQVFGRLSSISVGADDSVWGLNTAGQIYEHR